MATKPLDFSGTNPTGTPTALDAYSAASSAISFKEQLPDLASKLREALTTKFNESPLFAARENAMQTFLAAPSAIRADISKMQQESGVPFSPTQQESITGARRAAAFAPLSTSNLMLGTAYGGLDTMMQGGVKAFEAASTAQTERANLMNTIQQQEFERQMKEKQYALDVIKANKSEGLSFSNLMAMANFMKPTAGQEMAAINAASGSTSITKLKELIDKSGGQQNLFMSKYGLTRIFSKDAQKIYNESKNAIDVLTRMRTGAALNQEEQKFYDSFIGQWQQDPTVILDQLDLVDKIYKDVQERGKSFDLQSFLQSAGVQVPGTSHPLDVYWGK